MARSLDWKAYVSLIERNQINYDLYTVRVVKKIQNMGPVGE
jgi:hypothetical protein